MEFIRACAEDYLPSHEGELGRLVKREDGLLLLEGKEDRVGYRIVQAGIIVDGAKDKTFTDGIEGL